MRWVSVAAVVLALSAAPAAAHCYDVEGEILFPNPDHADTGLFALVETVAPGAIPNGVFYYAVSGVAGGSYFNLEPKNPGTLMVGLADECPGPSWRGPLTNALLSGDVQGALGHAANAWILCHNYPDFDVKFTGGDYGNGPGDEAGIVPGPGDAVITMFFGPPKSGFTWHSGPESCP